MYKQVCIDGIQTYLFRADELEEVLLDSGWPEDFLCSIRWHRKRIREIEGIDKVKLYPAVCHVEKINQWMPVYCLEMGETYYHVGYNEWWMCRDCGAEHGPVLRHQLEVDTAIYIGQKWPQIPKIFTKHYCDQCGHMLQCHLILLEKRGNKDKTYQKGAVYEENCGD